jgi:hypothetical protein
MTQSSAREVGRKGRRASSSPSGGQARSKAFKRLHGEREGGAYGVRIPDLPSKPSKVHSSRRMGHRASPGTDFVRTEGGQGDSHAHAARRNGFHRRPGRRRGTRNDFPAIRPEKREVAGSMPAPTTGGVPGRAKTEVGYLSVGRPKSSSQLRPESCSRPDRWSGNRRRATC